VWPHVVLGIYVVAFAVGTISHVLDILRWGIRPHNQYHWAFNLFWTSLAVFDPLAIVLLLRRRRAGLLLAGFIMILDVAVNVTAGLDEYLGTGRFLMWGLYTQVPFALFLLATAPSLWNVFERDERLSSALTAGALRCSSEETAAGTRRARRCILHR
jgi:hypothetical protein